MTRHVVHLIDDDVAARESLRLVLGAAGFEARPYGSAEQFLTAASPQMSGCILSDVRMEGVDGLEFIRRLQRMGVWLPIVMMTGPGDIALAVAAMKEGVLDILEKPLTEDIVLSAVARALATARGATWPTERQLFQQRFAALTPRETEVLGGVVEGKSNKQIARDLGVSPRTVEAYRAQVMRKTRSASISDLIRQSLLAGLGGSSRA
jgi:two-component system response regulator FixJ